ncbi:hypothetical protein CDZ97_11270 [Mameliella alba]|uniref:hypothetical protein n=1 Tax=Mameliella alba TaxID=561184 RepID=UPI000B52C2F1|nr:hypothetical protein [Mameliella alba]OWV64445.1 hypothetical protein CDZ97_11270 [Mameliella alba]
MAVFEIEHGDETRHVRLRKADARHVERLAEASRAGTGLPLADATAQRMAEVGVPLVRCRHGWQISDGVTIRQIIHA